VAAFSFGRRYGSLKSPLCSCVSIRAGANVVADFIVHKIWILGLIIYQRGVKPAVAMKPLSGIPAFIGLTVLAVLIAGCFVKKPAARLSEDVLFSIEIGHQNNPDKYVELIDTSSNGQKTLHEKLNNAKQHGSCKIQYKGPEPHATADPNYCDHNVTLKTDRVIKSELASNRGRDSSAANDPNVMHKVQSQDLQDITDIAALLKIP